MSLEPHCNFPLKAADLFGLQQSAVKEQKSHSGRCGNAAVLRENTAQKSVIMCHIS